MTDTAAAAAAAAAPAPAEEAAAAAVTTPKVAIVSSDGETFVVARDVVSMSVTLRNMLEDLGSETEGMPVPLPNVKADALRKVVEFCDYHVHHPDETSTFVEGGRIDNFRAFDRAFTDELREDKNLWLLMNVLVAANYLDIKPLVDVLCRTVASMIQGKTPEQICDTFRLFSPALPFCCCVLCLCADVCVLQTDIKKNPTEQELEEVKKANPWLSEL